MLSFLEFELKSCGQRALFTGVRASDVLHGHRAAKFS